MAQNTHIRERLEAIVARAPEEKQWWESRRSAIQSEFMKELDDEKAKSSADEGVLV
jgi:translocation protein SEC66